MATKKITAIILMMIVVLVIIAGLLFYNSSPKYDKCDLNKDGKVDAHEQKRCATQKNESRCGNGICDKKETSTSCSQDCETTTTTKTCSEQNGNICSSNEDCNGNWISSSDSSKCCDGECETSTITTEEISPFGIMAAFDMNSLQYISASDKITWAGEKFRDLGAKWTRAGGDQIIWESTEPTLGGGYDWSKSDEALKKIYENGGNGFNTVLIVTPSRGKGSNPDISSQNEQYFKNFVKALVERYDGDGVDDYNSDIKVKYWQADNEPFPRGWERNGGTIESYANFVEILSESAKESDSDAKIVLGADVLINTDISGIESVISSLKNKNSFDFIDVHYWPSAEDYQIPKISELRSHLNSNGYDYVMIMSLEHGTWAGQPSGFSSQTEKDQAKYLIKSYAYNLANGVSLINWNNLVEWSSYGGNTGSIYNYQGLIADGENGDSVPAGTSRLSYYTYKKMTETLEGSDWNNIEKVQESDGVYVYKFENNGKNIWVAWNDNSGSKQITISGITSSQVKITDAVPDKELGKDVNYENDFNTETKSVISNSVSITLDDVPVFVEEE